MSRKMWATKIQNGEELLLTVHQSGVVDAEELKGPRYQVVLSAGAFQGFLDPVSKIVYTTPSALCCAKLERKGSKKTNGWRGPRHCLVLRNGLWVPIGTL